MPNDKQEDDDISKTVSTFYVFFRVPDNNTEDRWRRKKKEEDRQLKGWESGSRSHHSLQYECLSCHTEYRSSTFFPHTVRDWNELPQEAVKSPRLGIFISRVSSNPK